MNSTLAAKPGLSPRVGTTSGGGSVPFNLVASRNALFQRLPAELQQQVVYKHFYTDDLGPGVGDLSLRFFGLCISYFCSLCRLEGRRVHYMQSASESSGQSFAKTHARTRHLFQRLNATYGVILLTYNLHSDLVYQKPKGGVIKKKSLEGNGPYSIGAKPLGPPVKRERAFEYFADELRFYEELLVFTEQMLRLAFTDDRLQTPIADEINRIFRGNNFNFAHLHREQSVRLAVMEMDQGHNALTSNHRQLAEVLVAPASRLKLRDAQMTRTPLVACRFAAGPMNAKKYIKPFVIPRLPSAGASSSRSPSITSSAELAATRQSTAPQDERRQSNPFTKTNATSSSTGYRVGTLVFAFPLEHRAMRHYLKRISAEAGVRHQHRQRSPSNASVMGDPSDSAFKPPSKLQTTTDAIAKQGNTFMPFLQDFDAEFEEARLRNSQKQQGEDDDDTEGTALNTKEENAIMDGEREDNTATALVASMFGGSMKLTTPTLKPTTKERLSKKIGSVRDAIRFSKVAQDLVEAVGEPAEERHRVAPPGSNGEDEDWKLYDPIPEIDKVYQSLANGVVISSVAIPVDILATYSERGFLLATGD